MDQSPGPTIESVQLARVWELVEKWRSMPARWRHSAARELEDALDVDFADGFGLKSLGSSSTGGVELQLAATTDANRALVLAIADAMGQFLDEHDTENYVEFELLRPGRRGFTVCVRYADKPTPHQLRRQAERERDAALAELVSRQLISGQLSVDSDDGGAQ